MARNTLQQLVAEQKILNRIYVVRRERVMLDRDLAELYGVETKRLKEAVKRNAGRFPKDFMFAMTAAEFKKWRENAIRSAADKKGRRKNFIAPGHHQGNKPGIRCSLYLEVKQ
ncbi:ORF6N domain-containing protein [Niabella pedocola]|uniref:ORF6N domain-containing protein n=1 Tax=Niabella pedocola TaxID=1752077 RepID=A0ABS8PUZ5_9BACT|nr:ORF6N domain-containing protein [Niabella pedocola]MCD2424886.1 ORF6N domain-containing protein [Niabella pedocola]